jgi:hypothetical protein
MRKVININIPEPCHEDWNTMTPQEKGRHCAVCNKTVVDFTKSTDEQLINTFESEGNLCGRFKSSQLNRDVVLSRKEKNNYRSLAASGLFAMLSFNSHEVKAQGATKLVHSDSIYGNQNLQKTVLSASKHVIVKGKIIDESGLPLPGAIVLIRGTTIGTTTNFDGDFSIEAKLNDTLIISYVGYKNKSLLLEKGTSMTISLDVDDENCSIVIVAGFAENSYLSSCEKAKRKKERKLHRQEIRDKKIERSSIGRFLYILSDIFRSKK